MKKLRVVLIVVIAIIVVVIAAVEIGGRPVLQSYIRGQIVKSLPGTDPVVTVGSGSLILQALSGHLDSVDVSIPDAPLGGITSDLTISAADVPLDTSNPIPAATIGVDATKAEVQTLVRQLDGFSDASVALKGDLSLGSSFSVFGQKIPFAIGVVPTADRGELVLTPSSVTLNGAKIALADLKKVPLGSNILSLVKPQRVCVAQYLPKDITLSGVKIVDNHLHLSAVARNIVLSKTDFSAVGSCK